MGVSIHPGADVVGDLRLEEMAYRTARAALDDAGVSRAEIDHVTLAASDEIDARGITSMLLAAPSGAYLKDEMRVTDSGLTGLHLGAMRAASGRPAAGSGRQLEPELGRTAGRHRADARRALLPATDRTQLRHRRRPVRGCGGRASWHRRAAVGERIRMRLSACGVEQPARGASRRAGTRGDRRIATCRPSAAQRPSRPGHRRRCRAGARLGRMGPQRTRSTVRWRASRVPNGRSTATSSTASGLPGSMSSRRAGRVR